MYMAIQTVLCVCVSVMDLVTVCRTVPFHRGYAVPHTVLPLDLAGRDLTENLMKFPIEREYPFATTAERKNARDVKENPCCIGSDYDTYLMSTAEIDKEETYKLPDGNIITVGAERFRCVEVLFQPCSRIHGTSRSVTLTPIRRCRPMSCRQLARPFSKGWLSAWRMN